MTTQPSFWGYATTTTRQGELFATGGQVTAADCPKCGTPLERTPSGYATCPRGCGKLLLDPALTAGE